MLGSCWDIGLGSRIELCRNILRLRLGGPSFLVRLEGLLELRGHVGSGISDVMDELASHSVGTPTIGCKLLAKLSLVEVANVCLDHHVGIAMGEGTLVTIFTSAM